MMAMLRSMTFMFLLVSLILLELIGSQYLLQFSIIGFPSSFRFFSHSLELSLLFFSQLWTFFLLRLLCSGSRLGISLLICLLVALTAWMGAMTTRLHLASILRIEFQQLGGLFLIERIFLHHLVRAVLNHLLFTLLVITLTFLFVILGESSHAHQHSSDHCKHVLFHCLVY